MSESTMTVTAPSGRIFEKTTELITIHSNAPRRDPGWKHTDAEGHEHRWVEGGIENGEWHITETWWCEECRDEHREGEWVCAICGEKLEPGMRGPDPAGTTVRGLTEYTIDGERVSEEQFTSELRSEMPSDD